MKKNKILFLSLLFLALTPVIWFVGKSGVVINGLDTNFPINPNIWFMKRFYVWDSTNNAGADISSSVSGLFFHFLQVLFYNLGLNLQLTQISTLVFWFGSLLVSAYFFSTLFLKKWQSQIVFVIFYCFNIYLFNTWENVKVSNLSLMVSLPFSLYLLDKLINKKASLVKILPQFFILFLWQMGSGINPAYFLTFILSNILFVLFNSNFKNVFNNFKIFFKYLLILFLFNAFWIFPLINYLFFIGKVNSVEEYGLTNWLDFLSQNTSYLNVIRGQGLWDWYALDEAGFPIYVPYALNYFYNVPFIVYSFVIPFFSFSALVVCNHNKISSYIRYFAFILILGLFLGVGGHSPTGFIYKFFVDNIPMFNFFRSPWYIFTPFTILAMSGLSAVLLDYFVNRLKSNIELIQFFYFALGIAIFSHFLYSYPLTTGKIFRPNRQDTFYVNYPDYVYSSINYLNKNELKDRIVVVPSNSMEEYVWKYRGVESLLSLGTNKEIVNNSSYKNTNFDNFKDRLYQYIQTDRFDLVQKIAQYLNVNVVWNRKDAYPLSQEVNFKNLEKKQIGEWEFYSFNNSSKIFSPKYIYSVQDNFSMVDLSLYAKNNSIFVLKNDSVVNNLDLKIANTSLFQAQNLKDNHIKYHIDDNNLNRNVFFITNNIDVVNVNFDKKLSNNRLESDAGIIFNNVPNSINDFEVVINDYTNAIKIDDIKNAQKSLQIFPYKLEDNFETVNFYYLGKNTYSQEILVSGFSPYQKYKISFLYKVIEGNAPILDVYQYIGNNAVNSQPVYLKNFDDWEKIEFEYIPQKVSSNLKLNLRVNKNSNVQTYYAQFKNLTATPIYENNAYLISEEQENKNVDLRFYKISPVKYKVNTDNSNGGYVVAFLENYSNGWILKTKNNVKIKHHFMINGYANAWYIPNEVNETEFEIYYQPQNIYYLGIFVSIGTIVLLIIYNLFYERKIK